MLLCLWDSLGKNTAVSCHPFSSFTFIKRLFSSSLLFAIKVESSAYLGKAWVWDKLTFYVKKYFYSYVICCNCLMFPGQQDSEEVREFLLFNCLSSTKICWVGSKREPYVISQDEEVIVYTIMIHKHCYLLKSLRIFHKCYFSFQILILVLLFLSPNLQNNTTTSLWDSKYSHAQLQEIPTEY